MDAPNHSSLILTFSFSSTSFPRFLGSRCRRGTFTFPCIHILPVLSLLASTVGSLLLIILNTNLVSRSYLAGTWQSLARTIVTSTATASEGAAPPPSSILAPSPFLMVPRPFSYLFPVQPPDEPVRPVIQRRDEWLVIALSIVLNNTLLMIVSSCKVSRSLVTTLPPTPPHAQTACGQSFGAVDLAVQRCISGLLSAQLHE